MTKIQNNELTHTANSGTSNIILGSSGQVTTQGVLTPTGGLSDNCIDGANIALGSDAAGDIMYYNGTDYVRLAKGTNGHYLKQGSSNAPEWAALAAGGLTEADNWRITTAFSGSADPIDSNWERVDGTLQPSTQLGSGMAVSSGVWTFPSTGYWYVALYHTIWKDGSTRYVESYISATANNGGAWDHRIANSHTHITQSSGSTFESQVTSTVLDITDTSNHKIRFGTAAASSVTTYGDTNDSQTWAIFMKLGAT